MTFRRACFCCELGETVRLRSFMPLGRCSLLVSWDERCRGGVPCGWRRLVVVLAFIGSRVPCPLGAGEYVRSAGVGSAYGEGVGGIVEVLLYLSSRRRFSLLASPSPCVVIIIAPLLHVLRSCPPASVPVSPAFSYGFLIVLLPVLAISRAGRSLPACPFVEALVPSSCSLVSCPCACLPP